MPRPTALDAEQREEITRLAMAGERPASIYQRLKDRGLIRGDYPHKRTVERFARQVAPPDPSGPWSLSDADPEEAQLVLDVLIDVLEETQGRVWLTRDVAGWIVRLRTAVPAMPTWVAYALARRYQARADARQDTADLDLFVAARPWDYDTGQRLSDERLDRWLRALDLLPALRERGEELKYLVLRIHRDLDTAPPPPGKRFLRPDEVDTDFYTMPDPTRKQYRATDDE